MARTPEQNKLEEVLQRFLQPDFKRKGSDEIYMEKLLSHLSGTSSHLIDLPICKEWIQKILLAWKTKTPDSSLASFALDFMGLFVSDWKRFELLQVNDVVGEVSQLLKQEEKPNLYVKLAYVRMLSGLLKHDSGCEWIVRTGTWKDILQLCYGTQSIYILRESKKFVVALLERLGNRDLELAGNIVSHVFTPLLSSQQPNALELACNILDTSLSNSSSVMARIIHKQNLESLVWMLLISLDGDSNEARTGEVSRLLTLVYFTGLERSEQENKIPYVSVKAMEKKIYNLLALHISRKSVTNFMNIIVQCQFCWSKISDSVCTGTGENSSNKHFNFDTQLMVFQLLPMLSCLRTKMYESECLELYTNKLFRLTSEDTQRLAYSYRDLLTDQNDKYRLAHRSMLSILQIKNIINRELAVIAYQAFMYNLKDFVISEPGSDGLTGPEFVVQHPEQLGAVLDGLTSLIKAFQITWRESVETICLFGFTQLLLRNPNLSPRLSVQSLQLMQVAIQNFMPPNLALLMNTLKGSSIDQLGPILRKRLHDVNWDVRDSALEVLQVVTSIAEIKFPAFQEHVVENELCPLVLVLAMDDSESYVRASAIKCLSAMVRVQRFWTDCLASQDLTTKMVTILQGESEGIVRREATVLLKEIYVYHKFLKAEMTNVFKVMTHAAISDLYWEVKVNALQFWEKVIERHMSNQGMIDGVFPAVTFSKEKRKIVTLTEPEIKARLNKVLEELAQLQCLQVLLLALQDHDLQVVYKATEIITTLNKVLAQHGLTPSTSAVQLLPDLVRNCTPTNFRGVYDSNGHLVDGISNQIQTTNRDSGEGELESTIDAEKVIDSIVNDKDVNLLASVYCDRLNVSDQASNMAISPMLEIQNNISAEEYLSTVSKLNLEELVAQKSRWIDYYSNNLGSLLDDILACHAERESDSMDCY